MNKNVWQLVICFFFTGRIPCNTSFLVSIDPVASDIDKPRNVNCQRKSKEKQVIGIRTWKALGRIIRSFVIESRLAKLNNC